METPPAPRGQQRTAFVVLMLACFWTLPAHAREEYLANGTFDTGLAGWTLLGDGGDTMEWDPAVGSPQPGSLRLSTVDNTGGGPMAVSECFAAPAGSQWEFRALAREAPGSSSGICAIWFLLYDEADCSGEIGAYGLGSIPAGSEWTAQTQTYEAWGAYQGFRVSPTLGAGAGTTASCHFDSLQLLGPPDLAVPTLGHAGMLALIAALGLAGAWSLHRNP